MSDNRHYRRSIRLKDYNYAQSGAYFVTICTHQRQRLFGEIVDDRMRLNACGEIVRDEWLKTPYIRPEVEIDAFVVMPNHIHGIIVFHDMPGTQSSTENKSIERKDTVGAHGRAPLPPPPDILHRPAKSLGSFVAGYKSVVTKRINTLRGTPSAPVWQRNYYETIIRDEKMLNAIRQYIETNPANWQTDAENK